MRRAMALGLVGALVLVGVLFLGACSDDNKDAANTSAHSTTALGGEPIVIREKLTMFSSFRAVPSSSNQRRG